MSEVTQPHLHNRIPFDPASVPLKDRNLIEASAGTGKTYSIAILVLRILIEEQPEQASKEIQEILLVTFTNAAVTELKIRTRLFIQQALLAAQGSQISDSTIQHLVDKAISQQGANKIREKLRKALLNFDQANILTIHSFCSRITQEYAFDSGMSFSVELNPDISHIIRRYYLQFIRRTYSKLNPEIIDFIDDKISIEQFQTAFKNFIEGKLFVNFHPTDLSIEEIYQNYKDAKEELIRDILDSIDELRDNVKSNTRLSMHKLLVHPEENIDQILDFNYNRAHFSDKPHPIWERCKRFQEHQKLTLYRIVQKLITEIQDYYYPQLKKHLDSAEIITYNTFIKVLYQKVVVENNPQLIHHIRSRYTAVFVDEFQDTDQSQYSILSKLFVEDKSTLLFLIGDPKQSIYAFRNAHIEGYLQTRTDVDHIYSMRTNFRSSSEMITATNLLYQAVGYSEAFGYEYDNEESIAYEPVQAGKNVCLKDREGNTITKVLKFNECPNQDIQRKKLIEDLAKLVLTDTGIYIPDKTTGEYRPIKPEDIAILVDTNKEAIFLKNKLNEIGIPSVITAQHSVFESSEARDLVYLLEAMLDPNENNLKTVLTSTFLCHTVEINEPDWVLKINPEDVFMLFAEYKSMLNEHKIYQAFYKLLDDFSVRQIFATDARRYRALANIEQLLQILQQKQYQNNWTAQEAKEWLSKTIDDPENTSSEEYEVQLETESYALKISTIHKSKGLEYPIVFIFINTSPSTANKLFLKQLNDKNNIRFFLNKAVDEATKQQLETDEIREYTRKWYVAITRPVYMCNVYYTNGKQGIHAAFDPFARAVRLFTQDDQSQISQYIAFEEVLSGDSGEENRYRYTPKAEQSVTPISFSQKVYSTRSDWQYVSFTALNEHHTHRVFSDLELVDEYDQFVFNQLPSGAKFGNELHKLFEHLNFRLDFKNVDDLPFNIRKRFEVFDKKDQSFSAQLGLMAHHVLHAVVPAPSPFTISEVEEEKCLSELQFYFHIDRKNNVAPLKSLLEQYQARIYYSEQTLRGMMDGAIDLFFEHQGRYYILDWKSNHLGRDLTNYQGQALKDAMVQNNYMLQYLIYTVAACRYIRTRNPGFDYERDFGGVIYMFVRGNREGSSTGVYFDKPDAAFIQQLMELL